MTFPASHKTVFLLDQSCAFAQSCEEIEIESAKSSISQSGFPPVAKIGKSIWSSATESVLEYCRIVWDIFPPVCEDWSKAVRAKCSNSRVHFKNTRETANAIKNMDLTRAKKYLENVLKKKEVVPFRVHTGGVGRTAQGKNMCKTKKNGGRTCSQGRWPVKSCQVLRDLLRNAESNADEKGLSTDKLYVSHIAVQRAPKMRRRTYRAHGRINPFMASPCHIELMLEEKGEEKGTD